MSIQGTLHLTGMSRIDVTASACRSRRPPNSRTRRLQQVQSVFLQDPDFDRSSSQDRSGPQRLPIPAPSACRPRTLLTALMASVSVGPSKSSFLQQRRCLPSPFLLSCTTSHPADSAALLRSGEKGASTSLHTPFPLMAVSCTARLTHWPICSLS